jgi:hypothetical protein
MTQNTPTSYTVANDEVVTITVVATKVGEFAVASLDGGTLNPIGTAPLKYRFTATKATGANHFVVIFCHFPDSAPNDAKYEISVAGSNGGGIFAADTVFRSDPPSTWNTTLTFAIA